MSTVTTEIDWAEKCNEVIRAGRAVGATDGQIKAALMSDASKFRIKSHGVPRMSDAYYDYVGMSVACEEAAKSLDA